MDDLKGKYSADGSYLSSGEFGATPVEQEHTH